MNAYLLMMTALNASNHVTMPRIRRVQRSCGILTWIWRNGRVKL